VPLRISISLYNSAGERVRQLFEGGANSLPIELSLSGSLIISGEAGVSLELGALLSNGQSSLLWTGVNDNGQAVSDGMYYFKVETTDPFGHVTSLIKDIQVIAPSEPDTLAVFNGAGELVWKATLGGSLGQAAGLSFSATTFAVAYDPLTGAVLDPLWIYVYDTSGGGLSAPWDGRSQTGAPLASGSYTVQLITGLPAARAVVQTKPIVILNTGIGAPSAEAYFAPNPVLPGKVAELIYSLYPGAHGTLRLYNLAGELVCQREDSRRTGKISLGGGPALASGIYLAEFEQQILGRPAKRSILKLAVVK